MVKIFFVFDAILSGGISMTFFLNVLLLMYTKATDICNLILYPATLQKLLIIPISFLVEVLGKLM